MAQLSRRLLRGGGAALLLGALQVGSTLAAPGRASVTISGAGSTFVAPVLTGQWVPDYTKAHSSVQIAYDGIGSGAGISLLTRGNIQFAGSDALLSAAQEKLIVAQCRSGVLKIPVTIGAVALIYNLPGVKSGLRLTPGVIASIFLGTISNWNDKQIQALNPGVTLPSLPISTIHRADGSGTTYITTHYLAQVSPQWQSKVGSGATVSWPNGTGAPKSSGVSAAVLRTPGGISYVDLAYAVSNNISYAVVQNKSGAYVAPGVDSASAAADSFARSMPADLQQIIVNSPAATAYPITGYSYFFMCARENTDRGHALVDFVRYVVGAGQAYVKTLYYAPLPASVQKLDTAALSKAQT